MIIYLDNIIIYSFYEENHEEYIYTVFKTLAKTNLYIKLSKCHFNAHEIDFLNY